MKLVKQHIHKLDFFIFCASIFTLPQSIKLSSKLLFISLVLGVLKSLFKKDFTWVRNHKILLLAYVLFFIYICTQGIIIDGLQAFLNNFERHYAPYLIFLLTPVFYNNRKETKVFPKVFVAGLFFTFILIFIMSFLELKIYDRLDVLNTFDLHHLYISLYILFAINYLLVELSRAELKKKKNTMVVMLLVLISFLFFFKSKAALGVFVFLLTYHAINLIKWNKAKRIVMLSITIVFVVVFKEYFYELYILALDFRLKIWNAASNVIIQNPFFGHGASNEYLQLNTMHFLSGDYDFLDSNYNAHNQYLSFLVRFGLIGLLLVLATYLFPINRIEQSLKKEYIGFLLVIFLMSLIESLFNRHHGIVFCTIMLYYYNTMKRDELID
jgi:O-antigen ligase